MTFITMSLSLIDLFIVILFNAINQYDAPLLTLDAAAYGASFGYVSDKDNRF